MVHRARLMIHGRKTVGSGEGFSSEPFPNLTPKRSDSVARKSLETPEFPPKWHVGGNLQWPPPVAVPMHIAAALVHWKRPRGCFFLWVAEFSFVCLFVFLLVGWLVGLLVVREFNMYSTTMCTTCCVTMAPTGPLGQHTNTSCT